jgi:hypothetical protein
MEFNCPSPNVKDEMAVVGEEERVFDTDVSFD